MKDTLRQVVVILTILATLIVNGLANALPLNGLNTGEISDRFKVFFVPAGYVFAIWGVIYIGLIAFAIFQALPAQKENPRLQATGWWISLGGLANSAWIFLWHYQQFPLTLVAMVILLITLIKTYLGMNIGFGQISKAEKWMAQIPFSVYLGWITVATVANVTDVLDYVKWDRLGISPENWMAVTLLAVLIITGLMISTRFDVAFTVVILWALAGIAVKHMAVRVISIPTVVIMVLILLNLQMTWRRRQILKQGQAG